MRKLNITLMRDQKLNEIIEIEVDAEEFDLNIREKILKKLTQDGSYPLGVTGISFEHKKDEFENEFFYSGYTF